MSAEVHVWQIPLVVPESLLLASAELLSPDERTRASRFHFERDAARFTVARASVRSILGAYLLQPARDLQFDYSKYGKPSLTQQEKDVRFNISHSGDIGLIAVTLGCDAGIDIEAIRPDVETDKLAERFFSVHERAALRDLPAPLRVPAFFRCWTCKEAFLKGDGAGLSRSLSSFDVEVNPERPAQLLATRPNSEEARRWFLHDIETALGYKAALAVEGLPTAIKIMRCHEP